MKKLLLLVGALTGLVLPARAINWTSLPGSVASGQTYTVSATHSYSGITTYAQMQILKNGALFMGGGGSGTNYVVTASTFSTDTGPQSIGYVANITITPIGPGSPQSYSTSGSVDVASANNPPTITWVQAPANVTVNQYFVIQARGNDQDGNLTNVFVWREWTPFAFDPGGNGYESYSDANGYSQSTPGTVTFMAQAQDSNGATSPVIYTTVNITNNAPTVTASAVSIYAGQSTTVSWSAGDPDGNFSYVNVWVTQWGSPYWDDLGSGGATGTKSWSSSAHFNSNNPASGAYLFVVRAVDSAGAFTDTYATFDVTNRAPTNPTITATVGGVTIPNNGYMWWPNPVTLTATLHDDDNNLVYHGIYQQLTTGASPDPGLWVLVGNGTPSNSADSNKSVSFTPNQVGRWDYHTDGYDVSGVGPVSGGASITVYAYGETNDAIFQSQSVPSSATTGDSFSVSITMANAGTSNRPWITDSSPHQLTSVSGVNWGVSAVPLPGGTVFPSPQTPNTATFAFNVTAPTVPGTYAFQWKMTEAVSGNPANFGTPSTLVNIVVTDNDPPSVPGGFSTANLTPASFTLNWTPSTDNSGSISLYEVYKSGTLLGTTVNPNYNVTGLTSNTAYNMTVRAKDAAGNWSALNSPAYPVTTALDPNGDIDGDGMTNGWEQTNFGSPTAGDPNGDPDSDGFTNIAEFNLGTDPHVLNAGTSTAGNSATPGGWPNSGTNTLAVGATAGQLTVDKSGAMTYSVPLWTTPGTAGMEPKLSLNYSSQAGNGIAGFGWSLSGASAITRGPQTLAIDGKNLGVTITGSDRFYLDGQRLVLIGGTGAYGAAGSEYRTELDSFTKVVAYGSLGTGPAYFKAWTKAGLIIEFGNTADSAYDAYGHTEALSWSVNQISDTVGNFMTYSYDEDAPTGVHRLSRIDYTGNGTTILPYASVQLEYEDRSDWTQGVVAGSPICDLKRLKYIRSYYGATVARTYTLDYRTNTGDQLYVNRSILTSLTETGSDGLSYPPLTFDYATSDSGWDARPAYVPPAFLGDNFVNSHQGWPTGTGTGFMDLNGDGRVDFVKAIDTTNAFYRNDGTTWVSDTSYLLPYPLASANATITDTGSRFVDLNGDGLVDYVYKKYGSNGSVQQNEAWLNNGAGWTNTPAWRVPAPIARDGTQNNDPLRGGRFVDINNDGRPDFVAFMTNGTGTANLAVYLNNGSGWDALNSGYSAMSYNLAKYKAQFVDLNGDGLPDIAAYYVDGGDILQKSWLNTGSGWTESVAYRLPQPIADATHPSLGAEFVDVNGDGLPDLIWYRENTTAIRGAAFNTGLGWLQSTDVSSRYAPPAPLSNDSYRASGAVVIDLNADGIPDIAASRDFGGGSTPSQFTNFGSLRDFPGASSSAQNMPLYLLQAGITNIGVDFVDFDSDGVVDVVWNRLHADGSTFYGADRNKCSPITDRLIKVTNGLGVAAAVTYKSLMDPTVYTKGSGGPAGSVNAIGPMYVVSEIGNDDGVGGQYNIDYAYSGLRSDRIRGSLGFETMTVTDSRTLIQSQTTFAQVYPFIGMPLESRTVTGSVTLNDTLVNYGQLSLNSGATRFVFAADSLTSTHDLDGSATGTVDTSVAVTDIDAYGNILKIVVNTDGYTKTTTSTYDNDATNWFLGRLRTATVVSADPSPSSITRTSSFTYNAQGLLETETVEPGNLTLAVTTTYGYDQFGNKTTVKVSGANVVVTDGNGTLGTSGTQSRTTTTQYDFHGRNPIWTENALSHHEDYYVYDEPLDVLRHMGGANGLPTVWEYDGFGRKLNEYRADGTSSHTAYRWVTSAPSQAEYYGDAPAAKYLVENIVTGSAPTLAFYDSFGRAFLSLGIAGDGKIIYQTTQYDAQGRAFAKSVPYFASPNGLPHAYWATTEFDLLNRPVTVTTPDEEASGGQVTSSSAYYGLQATATDPKGRVSRTIKNSQGWTTQNTRNENAAGGASASTVTYGYDAIGNLTSTVAEGSTTMLAYDLRGRKTSMVDPDMGTWQYRYNAFGELIWQKDAKGQITTMAYDVLGRITSRVEPEGTTTWSYDYATRAGGQVWKGKLDAVSSPGGYVETYDYDAYGRPATVWRTIPGVSNTTVEPRFFVTQTYDSTGRPLNTIYPSGFQTTNVYNDYGYLKEVRRADSNRNDVYWMADTYSVTGQVDGEYYGNGLINDRVYSEATGRLRTAAIGKGIETTAPFSIQYLQYNYDAVGNVTTRSDDPTGRTESFGYDGLDRLLTHVLAGYSTVSVTYNPNGNIASKSDVGNYAYTGTGPHALSGVSGGALGAQTYAYDANGNMTGGGGRTITWTSFNQVKRVQNAGNTFYSDFTFGASHERIKEVAHNATTVFIGALFERVTSGSLIENKHYIYSPTGRIAVRTERNDTTVDTRYFHTDGLGSITAVTNEAGQIVKRFAFDAWGKRLDPSTNGVITSTTSGKFTRGFTDHEQLDDLGLIHMNGRIYDPVLGRFLSADPFVGNMSDSQDYNRYSYLSNSPLGGTDPTGFFSLKDGLKIVAVVVAAYFTAGAAIAAWGVSSAGVAASGFAAGLQAAGFSAGVINGIIGGAAAGFASGFSGSLLNGGSIGDAFRSGIIGGVSGGITGGLLGYVGGQNSWNWFERGLAHGAVQGGAAEATGGEFRHGFYAGFAVGATEGRIGKWAGDDNAKGVTAAAVVGGTASVLGGGKFANGAVSGTFSYLFNWASRQDWPVHQTANKRALSGDLTPAQIALLDRATVLLDSDQAVEDEYMHAMRDLDHNQTVDQASSLADGYIRAQYQLAWDFLKAGKESLALFHFGLALHTLQDATSPSHWGFQGWTQKETDEGGSNIDVLKHVIPERNYPGDKSALYTVTKQAYGWYKQGSLPQQNLFVGLPHDK